MHLKFRQTLITAMAAGAFVATAATASADHPNEFQADPPVSKEVSGVRSAPNIAMTKLPFILPGHARPSDTGRQRMGPGGGCDKDVDHTAGSEHNARAVAALDTGICTNADIDVYTRDGSTYVVQGGADDAAWTHTDVTDPANPVLLGQFSWSGRAGKSTTTPDVKAFKQGANDYIALSLERTKVNGACGVVIVNVTDPTNPVTESQFIGADWCDTHNTFVEDDANGDGKWIFATANATADLRVLAISDSALTGASVTNPVEVGIYRRTDRNPPNDSDTFNDTYVHDVTVVDDVVYASYWLAGVDIFDASLIRQDQVTGLLVDETDPSVNSISFAAMPSGPDFLAHHAYPSADGSVVFAQDEITFAAGDDIVRMMDVATGTRIDELIVDDTIGDTPVAPSHNLEIRYDIDFDGDGVADPDRVFLGWYKLGLQAWDFDSVGFVTDPADQPRTAVLWDQAQTEANDDDYSGAWGVRLAVIGGEVYAFQSDRNFGLIVDCLGDGNGDLSGCPAGL